MVMMDQQQQPPQQQQQQPPQQQQQQPPHQQQQPQQPSPQCVGREFVRQYYTLLNQAPLHLHRFYSRNSSFVHGGLGMGDKVPACDEPVMGQQEIHRKIMQLNFRDCHAKIRQVDAHATLGSGVVVQVSGELSNNGQPMRRFMQTFVLAPQSPKKYYVHNDIFRYQDEVFSEDEREGADSGTTSILDESGDSSVNLPPGGGACPPVQAPLKEPIVSVRVSVVASQHCNGSGPSPKEHVQDSDSPAPVVAATPEEEEIATSDMEVEEVSETPMSVTAAGEEQHKQVETAAFEESASSNGPLTYATLVKSGATAAPGTPAAPPTTTTTTTTTTTGFSSSGPPSGGFNKPSSSSGNKPPLEPFSREGAGGKPFPRGQSHRIGGRGGGMGRDRYGSSNNRNDGDDDRRDRNNGRGGGPHERGSSVTPSNVYNDAQQVFVGNLPHNCTMSVLQTLFEHYGKVADVRINNKSANASKTLQTGQLVPNFGFVVFEDERSVQDCLKNRPIMLPDNRRLNVEEKKNKARDDNRGSSSANRQGSGSFDRGSQDNLGGRTGGGMSERGGRGSASRGGQRSGSRGGYGGGGRGGGPQSQMGAQQRPVFARKS